MLYRQLVPSEIGIRGAASAVTVDINSNTDNVPSLRALNADPPRSGRPLSKLWNLRSLPRHMFRKYCTSLSMLAVVFSLHPTGFGAVPPKSERHVVIVVWDGMRPDFVSEQNTPALRELAREGVTFRNHHAVYPSATMVNGTALVTGVYPSKNGIIANHVYRPDIDLSRAIDVEIPAVVNKGDELSGGKYISVPTIAELMQRAGGRSVVAAAKSVGLLLDRHAGVAWASQPSFHRQDDDATSINLFAGKSLPLEILPSISETLGPFPSAHLQQDSWTTKALTDFLWKDGLPVLSILWLGEPDLTQHESAPGAPPALAAIKSADENLAAVLAAIDQRGAHGTTDIFIVSDHGFSTIRRSIDLRKILSDRGFTAKTEFSSKPQPGDIMLAGNGGSVLFYVIGHEKILTRRLVEFLQQSDFTGVIFTKEPMEGTFGLAQANMNPPEDSDAPDVVMAFHWSDAKNQFGIPGMIDADWQRMAGKGTHATLSRFDMHNMLIAAGPDFPRGQTDDLPSGNIDLAPTILQILGITAPGRVDGRILSEAMVGPTSGNGAPKLARHTLGGRGSIEPVGSRKPETNTIEATKDFQFGTWRQSLRITRIGSTIYLDEGNGTFTPK
jgi:arylsulfatase A-like enzyme